MSVLLQAKDLRPGGRLQGNLPGRLQGNLPAGFAKYLSEGLRTGYLRHLFPHPDSPREQPSEDDGADWPLHTVARSNLLPDSADIQEFNWG